MPPELTERESVRTFQPPMSKVSLRRLLSRLTAIALSTTAVGAAAADRPVPVAAGHVDSGSDEIANEAELELEDIPIDPEHIDPPDAAIALGRSLALAIGNLRPIIATQLAATWALSHDELKRLALAHALEWQFPLVGDAIVIDHLSRDHDPAVRAATARAAWARRATGGDGGVLSRLVVDPDPIVAMIARGAR